jgi:hypothetical protein
MCTHPGYVSVVELGSSKNHRLHVRAARVPETTVKRRLFVYAAREPETAMAAMTGTCDSVVRLYTEDADCIEGWRHGFSVPISGPGLFHFSMRAKTIFGKLP